MFWLQVRRSLMTVSVFSGVYSMQISTIATISVFFHMCDFLMQALSSGSLSVGSLSLALFFFLFFFFDLRQLVMYTRFESVVVTDGEVLVRYLEGMQRKIHGRAQ